MRAVSIFAILFALSLSAAPLRAAPEGQPADPREILAASAQAMDSAQSMRFAGAMDMDLGLTASRPTLTLPLSGAYQAPDRMSMTMQMPGGGSSIDLVMVGSQVWMRTGQGTWKPQEARGGSATVVGMSHAEWFSGFTDPVMTDVGTAYRITAGVDLSDAVRAGYGSQSSGGLLDLSSSAQQITLTIDKATSYMTAMQLELALPIPELSATIAATMNVTFSDFNNAGVDILAPA